MRIITFRWKKTYFWLVLGAAAVLLAGLLITALTSGKSVATAAEGERLLPIYCVETKGEKKASLSFDAAWGNEDTQHLIDILGTYGVKATFFVVGDWVDKYPESVKALADAGHEIMNHSDSHPYMTKLSTTQMAQEINACADKIAAVTGVRPDLFRAPYGDYNNAVIKTLAEEGHFCIQWDVDSLDWKDLSAADITSRVTSRVQPGSICLFHNAAKHTPEALPGIIEALQSDGYTLVPISKLILRENYTIDHTGRQIANG